MDGMFSKKAHRKVTEPQLAAMVDVFSLLIVFLVLGTVFNAASVSVPDDLKLPLSMSRESIEVTHQVIVQNNQIDFDFLKKKVDPVNLFSVQNAPVLDSMRSELKNFVAQIPKTDKNSTPQQIILNVVADQSVPYKLIFDVVKLCKEAGFASVLFITMGK